MWDDALARLRRSRPVACLHTVGDGGDRDRIAALIAVERPAIVVAAGGDGTMHDVAVALHAVAQSLPMAPIRRRRPRWRFCRSAPATTSRARSGLRRSATAVPQALERAIAAILARRRAAHRPRPRRCGGVRRLVRRRHGRRHPRRAQRLAAALAPRAAPGRLSALSAELRRQPRPAPRGRRACPRRWRVERRSDLRRGRHQHPAVRRRVPLRRRRPQRRRPARPARLHRRRQTTCAPSSPPGAATCATSAALPVVPSPRRRRVTHVEITLARPLASQVDGEEHERTDHFEVSVLPHALRVCVP